MKPIVIGILGRIGSGKTTAAKHLVDTHGGKVFSFARPLKELSIRLFAFTEGQVWGTQEEKETVDPRWGISPRTAMIRLGDGARETMGKRVWIDACFNRIMEDHEKRMYVRDRHPEVDIEVPIYVIDDVRYPNEAAAVNSYAAFTGFVVKLVCPDSDGSSAYHNAPSEVSVDQVPEQDIAFEIVSTKSPGSIDLKSKIDIAVTLLLEGAATRVVCLKIS